MTRTYSLLTAPADAKYQRHWVQRELSWSSVVAWLDLKNPTPRKETKGYVGGLFETDTTVVHKRGEKPCTNLHRQKEFVIRRSLLMLDADKASQTFYVDAASQLGCAAAYYTTSSHTIEDPRWRLVAPLDRDVTPDEYRTLARVVMAVLRAEQFDPSTDQPERFMYTPSTPSTDPSLYDWKVVDGGPLPVDEWLARAGELGVGQPGEPPTKPAPTRTYDGPGYDGLSDGHRAMADRLVAGVVDDWRNTMADVATWPEGRRDHRERGWEAHVRDLAWAMAKLAGTPWTGVDEARAYDLFIELWPQEMSNPEWDDKWSGSLLDKAAAHGPMEAPWEAFDDDLPDLPNGALPTEQIRGAWTPVDMTRLLAGGLQSLEPTLMHRTDGLALLYPGRTHSFSGESGSGKSWLAQWVAAEVLRNGGPVLYLDYESSAGSVVERLRNLGCTDDQLGRLVYVNPGGAPKGVEFDALLEQRLQLAIIDGVTEALATSGLVGDSLTNNNDAVTKWHAMLPKRIAESTGAAVVQVDHVTKSKDNRGGYAIGGQAKRASITGAAYVVQTRERFGRGRSGAFDLYVSKDREGHVLGALHGEEGRDGSSYVGRVAVTCSPDRPDVQLAVLPARREPTNDQKQGALMTAVCDYLGKLPADHEGANTSAVKDKVAGRDNDVAAALNALVDQGYVQRSEVGKAKLHKLVKAYAFEDDL